MASAVSNPCFAVGTPDATSSYFDSADDFPAAAEAGKSALTAP